MNQASVKDYRGIRFVNWWRFSIKVARELVRDAPGFIGSLPVRAAAFGPIRAPIFILGCPRSGTTYLGNVLEMIPGVSYYFEPPIIKYYTRLIYEGKVSDKSATLFYRLCFRSLLLFAPGTGTRVIEKNPNHTWIADTLIKIFPDALFIVITRDGRDTAASLLQKPWHLGRSASSGRTEPGGYRYGPYPHFYIEKERADEYLHTTDAHRCIWIWKRHAEQIELLKQTLPVQQQHHLKYEDLVSLPEESLSKILDFLGENDACTRAKIFEAAKEGYASSVGRWHQFLSDADLEVIEKEAGELLRKTDH